MAKRVKIPKLPQLLDRKIYKSGQTRGADDDEIYQNRVNRNSTALIRYNLWTDTFFNDIPDPCTFFEKDFIVLIDPVTYFSFKNPKKELARYSLRLGVNCLVFYQQRQDWDAFPPETRGWKPATSRVNPLGGEYVARVHGTTAAGVEGEKIAHGFTTTGMKGAGIRVYEYVNSETTKACRIQLIEGIGRWTKAYEAMCEHEEAFREDYELWKDEFTNWLNTFSCEDDDTIRTARKAGRIWGNDRNLPPKA